jgi:hypothetical protein
VAAGCVEYDPPPEPSFIQPEEGGAFAVGEEIRLEFSEPVAEESLVVRIWPGMRTIEGEIPEESEPLVPPCNGPSSECGDVSLVLDDDGMGATVQFDPEGTGEAGPPMILEVAPGLEDSEGNETGTGHFWDFQFQDPNRLPNDEPVPFDNGTYILVSSVKQPIPSVLTLISDVRVNKDGTFALAGAEGDEVDGAAKNTRNPEELFVDDTPSGWTIYANGFISYREGRRFLVTDPFNVFITIGPIEVEMKEARLNAEIIKDDRGYDQIEGTLSYGALRVKLAAEKTYEGSSVAIVGDYVVPDEVPEGHPKICGDLCGAVPEDKCDPGPDFPADGFCEAPPAQSEY